MHRLIRLSVTFKLSTVLPCIGRSNPNLLFLLLINYQKDVVWVSLANGITLAAPK